MHKLALQLNDATESETIRIKNIFKIDISEAQNPQIDQNNFYPNPDANEPHKPAT